MLSLRRVVFMFALGAALCAIAITPVHAFLELEDVEEEAAWSDCRVGEVPITSATRAAARAAGYEDEMNCWKPQDPTIGLAAGTAKLYLRSILCAPDRDNYGGAGADGTIAGLNAGFAVCAATFLKAASAEMAVCLKEGYRTEAKQQEYADRYRKGTGGIACDPASKKCEHPSGIAIDVNVLRESDYPKLWNAAPQYGLSFYLRENDKYHFVPTKEGCLALANPSGNPARDLPIEVYDFKQYAPTVNPFQNPNTPFFMPPMQQQQQSPQQQQQSAPYMPPPAPQIPQSPALPSAPAPSGTNPIPASQTGTTPPPTNPVAPATPSTPTAAPTPAAPAPSSAPANGSATPVPAATALPPSTTPVASESPATTPSETGRPAWIDMILGIAKFDSPPISESVPLQMEQSPVDPEKISQMESAAPHIVQVKPSAPPTTPASPPAVQTFTSSDLSTSPGTTVVPDNGEISRMLTSLAQLRAGLEKFLGVAQPPRPAQDAARWYPSAAF